MSAVLALLASVCYGTADFVGGTAAKRVAIRNIILINTFAALAASICLAIWIGGDPADVRGWGWSAIAGCAIVAALAALYRALAIGPMSVVAPLTALLAVTCPIVAGLLLGHELPSRMTAVGLVIGGAAIAVISGTDFRSDLSKHRTAASRSIPLAVAAGIAIGIYYISLARVGPQNGLYPLVCARTIAVAVVLIGLSMLPPSANGGSAAAGDVALIAASGCLDGAATACYQLALNRGGTLPVVATLASMYPITTVLLAAALLRERVSAAQRLGLVLALAAVALIVGGGG